MASRIGTPADWLRALLRVPLFIKIVVANLTLLAAIALLSAYASSPGGWDSPTLWAGGFLLLALLNGLLVRLALRPLRQIEAVVRRVEEGDPRARVPESAIADRELHRLAEVVNRMLDAIEGERHLKARLNASMARAEEAERGRIAGELFNDTSQTLSAALLHLQLAARHLDGGPGSERDPGRELESARADVLAALSGIQRIARSLRPPELDELGPFTALAGHARRITQRTGVPVELSGALPPGTLEAETSLAFFRVLQEAVTNAAVHGAPSKVQVSIEVMSGEVRAAVSDDGRGFDVGALDDHPEAHLGVRQMFERSRQVQGELQVRSGKGEGTTVVLRVPRSQKNVGVA